MAQSNFEEIMMEAKQKTLEWLAIKHRLIDKGYDKNNLKIKIGYWYEWSDEGYPIYLNVCENYHSSFRLDTNPRYNSARSIFELIIYKEESYNSMFFEWDTDLLNTYKYLFFQDKEEFEETNAYSTYYDSEFDLMCFEEEKNFRG